MVWLVPFCIIRFYVLTSVLLQKKEYIQVNKLGIIHKIQCYTPVTSVWSSCIVVQYVLFVYWFNLHSMLNYNILLMAQQWNEPIYTEVENIPFAPPPPHLLNTYISNWKSSDHWTQMLPNKCMLKLKISAITDRQFLLHWSRWLNVEIKYWHANYVC